MPAADGLGAVVKTYEVWRVRLWFKQPGPGGYTNSCESGGDIGFESGAHPLNVISEVARMRNVDLSICYSVEAQRLDVTWEQP